MQIMMSKVVDCPGCSRQYKIKARGQVDRSSSSEYQQQATHQVVDVQTAPSGNGFYGVDENVGLTQHQ